MPNGGHRSIQRRRYQPYESSPIPVASRRLAPGTDSAAALESQLAPASLASAAFASGEGMVNPPAMAVPLASRLAVAAPPIGSSEWRQLGWTVVAAATSAVGTLYEPASEPLARCDAASSYTSVATRASPTRPSAGGDVGPVTGAVSRGGRTVCTAISA